MLAAPAVPLHSPLHPLPELRVELARGAGLGWGLAYLLPPWWCLHSVENTPVCAVSQTAGEVGTLGPRDVLTLKESRCWKLLYPCRVRRSSVSGAGMGPRGSGARAAAAGTSLQAVFCVVLAGLGRKEDTSVLMLEAMRWQESHA